MYVTRNGKLGNGIYGMVGIVCVYGGIVYEELGFNLPISNPAILYSPTKCIYCIDTGPWQTDRYET